MLTPKKIEELQAYIASKVDYLQYAYRMYDIYNKNISPYLEKRIQENFKTETSRKEASSRLCTVNLLPKIVNKLSKAYVDVRIDNTSTNQVEVDNVLEKIDFKEKRLLINKMLNLNNCCAVEPVFLGGDDLTLRVLPAHTFLVYSDDPLNPEKATHFIKIVSANYSASSTYKQNSFANKSFLNNCEFHIYDNESYAVVRDNKLVSIAEHTYKEIPFVYIKKDTTELMPRSNKDDYEMVTLLPLLLTDNNFALKYKAFSIFYTVNCESTDMELSPNAIWSFQATGSESDKIEVGNLVPSLNTDEAIKNITTQYALWLETKNLKSPVFQETGTSNQSLSGIAKIIDEADVSADVSQQRDILSAAENKIFKLIENMAFFNGINYSFG